MNAEEIKKAVDKGKIVRWGNGSSQVIKDKYGQYMIKSGGHYVGLTWQDGTTLNGKEGEFYIEN